MESAIGSCRSDNDKSSGRQGPTGQNGCRRVDRCFVFPCSRCEPRISAVSTRIVAGCVSITNHALCNPAMRRPTRMMRHTPPPFDQADQEAVLAGRHRWGNRHRRRRTHVQLPDPAPPGDLPDGCLGFVDGGMSVRRTSAAQSAAQPMAEGAAPVRLIGSTRTAYRYRPD